MSRLTITQRFEFDLLVSCEDRLAYAVIHQLANDGHGDIGSCGVAEFDRLDLSEALSQPPSETLRRLKQIATQLKGLSVEQENTVLFALAGAEQDSFDHLYKSRGYEGIPPNLPKAPPRYARI